eukprot:Rhum_TRINITY_DN684_c0_g1::Rhum_TRINITY_DN684_c0_g1_i1::g.2145::m.2145
MAATTGKAERELAVAQREHSDAAAATATAGRLVGESEGRLASAESREAAAVASLAAASADVSLQTQKLQELMADMEARKLQDREAQGVELRRRLETSKEEEAVQKLYIQQLEERCESLKLSAQQKNACQSDAALREEAMRKRAAELRARVAELEAKLAE